MPFIPHSAEQIKNMLHELGVASVADLLLDMPKEIPPADLADIVEGCNERQLTLQVQQQAKQIPEMDCFIGAGAYQHFIPAAVWQLASRGEFLTAYTPYQPEASQGSLQLIYEFQTAMTRLLAMEVSNASLYDGATALVEAIMMAHRVARGKKKRVLVSSLLHPHYTQVLQTFCKTPDIELCFCAIDHDSGVTDVGDLQKQFAKAASDGVQVLAVVVANPNFIGSLEEVDTITDMAHAASAQLVAVVNPLAMSWLKPPGKWGQNGADIVCGDAQPLGMPLCLGGPYAGFLCCRQRDVRQMPGRLVGRTYDKAGVCGYTLTLQAREQHIRRAKAKSNVCTNQGLLVVAATIYMSLLGGAGMQEVVQLSHQRAVKLYELLLNIPGVRAAASAPFLYEFLLQLDVDVSGLLSAMERHGIAAGVSLSEYDLDNDYPNTILICVTEMRTEAQITRYARLFADCLQDLSSK